MRIWSLGRLAMLAPVLVLTGCLQQVGLQEVTPARYVPAQEIRQELIGNSLYRRAWRGAAKFQFASIHRPDGTVTAKSWTFSSTEEQTGVWRITEDGLYCRTWDQFWAERLEGCFSIARATEDGRLIFDHVSGHPGSSKRYIYQVLAGNPHRL